LAANNTLQSPYMQICNQLGIRIPPWRRRPLLLLDLREFFLRKRNKMKTSSHRFNAKFFIAIFGLLLLFATRPHSTVAQTNTFPASGNAGVGTTSPTNPLQVTNGSGTAAGVRVDAVTATTGNGGALVLNTPSGSNHLMFETSGVQKWVQYVNGNDLRFYAAGGGDRFTMQSTGNVGIGTTSPSERLHVAGGSLSVIRNEMSLWLANNSAGGETDWAQNAYYNSGWKYRLTDEASRIQLLDGKTIFSSAAAGSADASLTWTNNLSILQNGNVGIGTTGPPSVFTVQTTGADNAGEKYLRVKSTNSYTGILLDPGQAGDAGWLIMGGFPGAGDFTLREYGVGNYFTVKKSTGFVGIGNPNPTKKLDVTGDINATGTITGGNIVAKYQDVAEWVESSQSLPAGTVVVLDQTKSNQVIASTHAYDTRVAGVISAQPGITLGEKSDSKVLVATTGRVKVRVDATNGPIQVGDLLVTSDTAGVAQKSEPLLLGGVPIHRPGTLIGKALEPLAKGTGEILVLLSLQ